MLFFKVLSLPRLRLKYVPNGTVNWASVGRILVQVMVNSDAGAFYLTWHNLQDCGAWSFCFFSYTSEISISSLPVKARVMVICSWNILPCKGSITLITKTFLLLLLVTNFRSFWRFKKYCSKEKMQLFLLLKTWDFNFNIPLLQRLKWVIFSCELLTGDSIKTRWFEDADKTMNHTV